MIFVAKNIYVLCPTCACYLAMSKHTSGELIMIFGLTEIFILNLGLFSFVN
jgi:hypothetical protein